MDSQPLLHSTQTFYHRYINSIHGAVALLMVIGFISFLLAIILPRTFDPNLPNEYYEAATTLIIPPNNKLNLNGTAIPGQYLYFRWDGGEENQPSELKLCLNGKVEGVVREGNLPSPKDIRIGFCSPDTSTYVLVCPPFRHVYIGITTAPSVGSMTPFTLSVTRCKFIFIALRLTTSSDEKTCSTAKEAEVGF